MSMYDYYDDIPRTKMVSSSTITKPIDMEDQFPSSMKTDPKDDFNRDQSVKHDGGKRRLELIPTTAYEALGDVLTYGAKLYGDNTWNRVDRERYVGALLRHLCLYLDDPLGVDKESGLPHIDHVFTNAMFLTHKVHEERKRRIN